MKTIKNILTLALAAVMAASIAACGAKETDKEPSPAQNPPETTPTENASPTNEDWVNGGLTLTIPSEFTSLVLVDTPQDDPDGVLFSVSEKDSVDAGAADGHDAAWGDGWLFGIRRVSADELHELLCWDMSGVEVFARDAENNYYLFTHPTDVRLYRQNNAYDEAMAQWTTLNDWGWNDVRRDFLAENTGLTAFERGNSIFDMYLARAAYQEDANYSVITFASDPITANGVSAAPYVERLMDYTACEDVDVGEAPAGEFIVLDFPDDEVRLDFFLAEGKENYVRQINYNTESLMKLTFADDTKASEVVREWFDELVFAQSNPMTHSTPDDLVGRWAEKIAGRGVIEITKADDGVYNVEIGWSSSAFEKAFWEMNATPAGEYGALQYSDAKHYVRTFTSDTEYTDEVVYEDGSGLLYISADNELMWGTDKDSEGGTFVKID